MGLASGRGGACKRSGGRGWGLQERALVGWSLLVTLGYITKIHFVSQVKYFEGIGL